MLVIAHRGASGNAPENTMAAFKKAVALGASFIETDLQLSRDARFVAIHDATVNRTTNGQGTVHEMTLTELRRLDAGSWFGSEFAGERMPTVEEIAAVKKAVVLGANFIETDLQLSRDARFVAIHDATVNRTTNGQGTV